MAYNLVCRLSDLGSEGYHVRLTLPDGRNFERRLANADLEWLSTSSFASGSAEVESVAADFYRMLFAGGESLLDEAIARGRAEADPLTRVLMEITERLDYLPWELAALGKTGKPDFEIVRSVSVAPRVADKVPTLPFRVLVANMGPPHEDTRTFPLRTVLLNIFGDAERLTKVFHPSTMAGIDRDELAGVLGQSRYDIVHLQVLTDWLHPGDSWNKEGIRSQAMIAVPGDGPPLVAGTLLPLLERAQTRLLILHLRRQPYAWPQAEQLVELARGIVEGGGPAVLVMPFDGPDPLGGTVMLNSLYGHIVHDVPLDAALYWARHAAILAQSPGSIEGPIAAWPILILGQGAENLLRVSPLAVDLLQRTRGIRSYVSHLSRRVEQLTLQSALDLSGTNNILASAGGMFDQAEQIAGAIGDWQSESRGLMPLYEATQAADEGQRELLHLESEIERAEESSARVVNLCFLRDRKYVPGDEPLLREAQYELRLQISRPWRDQSIVRDALSLPDHYLDAHSDETGIDLDICLYTEDFSLPRGDVFPLRLPRAPAASNHLDIMLIPKRLGSARLRVCIYYSQNLVQSLAVVARVSARSTKPRRGSNYAEVEFSMADSLRGIEQLPPRTINVLTNDNGDGTHKIAIRGTGIKLQYTLTGSTAISDVRKTLLSICADVDKDGKPTRYHYSDDDNSGDESKLVGDLKELAAVGEKLYTDLITEPANWDEQDPLELALKQPGEIQISITHSARNVYPWALLYDRKLESGPGIDVCPVMLKKLTSVDQPVKVYSSSCIDGGCPHTSDVKIVCPLGFWGFRHAIEQLPPNQGRVVDTITARQPPSLLMGVHQKLAGKSHRAEVEKEAGLTANYCDLKAAISTALKSTKPHVVYFYCHGGHSSRAPWLGVGDDEQIAPGDFRTWDTNKNWLETTPIVVVNGCHTVDLNPDDLLDFVKMFAWCRAAGVIGTEIAIPESLAREFGRFFIRRFAHGEKIAAIFREFRLTLLVKRNVLGLSYTPYCHGDLHLMLN